MNIIGSEINGVYIFENYFQRDKRGLFIKPFTYKVMELKTLLHFDIKEIFYSISKKNVIRGMHFQRPPMELAKLIYLTSGRITDVLLDLRKSSKTYKNYITIELAKHENALLIPPGIAHGFLSLEDDTTVVYNQSAVYSREHDDGIHWNSFGYDWKVNKPLLSKRDRSFIEVENFDSPFD
jgi:dTDP-4-dehydrorhamnose 3,5-epimerase